MQTNREIYDTATFGEWSDYPAIEPYEVFLARTFLDPRKLTVEAGTGGGRIVLGLRDQLGFSQLHAFDYVPHFAAEVRDRDKKKEILVSAQDATRLAYRDESFDQVIYLGQILCLIEGSEARVKAMREAFRILRPGGVALVSFPSHEVRSKSRKYRLYLAWLRTLRFFTRPDRDMQTMPWLRYRRRFNRAALLDRGPYVYWYRAPQAVAELESAGFQLRAVATHAQLKAARTCYGIDALMKEPFAGHLYCVCAKPKR